MYQINKTQKSNTENTRTKIFNVPPDENIRYSQIIEYSNNTLLIPWIFSCYEANIFLRNIHNYLNIVARGFRVKERGK